MAADDLRRRRTGDTFLRLALPVSVACAVAGFLGIFGGLFEPADMPNQFAPAWLALGVVSAVVVVAFNPGRRAIGLLLLTFLIGTGLFRIAPEFLHTDGPSPQVGPNASSLKIIEFNIWKSNRDPAATAAWIRAQDPDIVVLADVARQGQFVADRLRADYPYSVRCNDKHCSTMLLSKRQPLRAGGLAKGDPENRVGLSAVWATFSDVRGPFTVVGVHLPRPWPFGDQWRFQRLLVAATATLDRRRMIVAGDFNDTPWSSDLQRLDRNLDLPRRTRALFSWPARLPYGLPAPFPILPIDQVYAALAWRTDRVTVGPRLGSDHYPLVIELSAP
jgi:endonuclease/exonuclease/phosphatase (EEP) superfamily protein YafD